MAELSPNRRQKFINWLKALKNQTHCVIVISLVFIDEKVFLFFLWPHSLGLPP
jgi:hypothetical protein